MISTEWIGYIAACFTTFSFVPQVWHTSKTRHTKDISLRMYLLFISGAALWLTYGIQLEAWPIIAANAATLILAGTVLALKLRHG